MFYDVDWKMKGLRDRGESRDGNYLLSDGDEGRFFLECGFGLWDWDFCSKFRFCFCVVFVLLCVFTGF